jgi:hypothetical protein
LRTANISGFGTQGRRERKEDTIEIQAVIWIDLTGPDPGKQSTV